MILKLILGVVLMYFFVRGFWNILHNRKFFYKPFNFRNVGGTIPPDDDEKRDNVGGTIPPDDDEDE